MQVPRSASIGIMPRDDDGAVHYGSSASHVSSCAMSELSSAPSASDSPFRLSSVADDSNSSIWFGEVRPVAPYPDTDRSVRSSSPLVQGYTRTCPNGRAEEQDSAPSSMSAKLARFARPRTPTPLKRLLERPPTPVARAMSAMSPLSDDASVRYESRASTSDVPQDSQTDTHINRFEDAPDCHAPTSHKSGGHTLRAALKMHLPASPTSSLTATGTDSSTGTASPMSSASHITPSRSDRESRSSVSGLPPMPSPRQAALSSSSGPPSGRLPRTHVFYQPRASLAALDESPLSLKFDRSRRESTAEGTLGAVQHAVERLEATKREIDALESAPASLAGDEAAIVFDDSLRQPPEGEGITEARFWMTDARYIEETEVSDASDSDEEAAASHSVSPDAGAAEMKEGIPGLADRHVEFDRDPTGSPNVVRRRGQRPRAASPRASSGMRALAPARRAISSLRQAGNGAGNGLRSGLMARMHSMNVASASAEAPADSFGASGSIATDGGEYAAAAAARHHVAVQFRKFSAIQSPRGASVDAAFAQGTYASAETAPQASATAADYDAARFFAADQGVNLVGVAADRQARRGRYSLFGVKPPALFARRQANTGSGALPGRGRRR